MSPVICINLCYISRNLNQLVSEEAFANMPQNVLKAEQLFYQMLSFLLDHQIFTQPGASQMAFTSSQTISN
jgi:hypothetical protein